MRRPHALLALLAFVPVLGGCLSKTSGGITTTTTIPPDPTTQPTTRVTRFDFDAMSLFTNRNLRVVRTADGGYEVVYSGETQSELGRLAIEQLGAALGTRLGRRVGSGGGSTSPAPDLGGEGIQPGSAPLRAADPQRPPAVEIAAPLPPPLAAPEPGGGVTLDILVCDPAAPDHCKYRGRPMPGLRECMEARDGAVARLLAESPGWVLDGWRCGGAERPS